jgi:hypothetical protein
VAEMLLSGSATVLLAQNAATPTCPFGHEPGYGRSLTPEQRAEHRAGVQLLVTELLRQARRRHDHGRRNGLPGAGGEARWYVHQR